MNDLARRGNSDAYSRLGRIDREQPTSNEMLVAEIDGAIDVLLNGSDGLGGEGFNGTEEIVDLLRRLRELVR